MCALRMATLTLSVGGKHCLFVCSSCQCLFVDEWVRCRNNVMECDGESNIYLEVLQSIQQWPWQLSAEEVSNK